jgi:hypothetical protein
MKEIFSPGVGVPLDAPHIVGAVSTIFWMLMLVVTLKYVLLILRADNQGEGGIMALTALAVRAAGSSPARRTALLLTGVFGAALFYGDSVITPAISVLGAAEGLEVVAPGLAPWVVPISVAILAGLFLASASARAASASHSAGDRALVRHARRHRRVADRAGAADPAGARPARGARVPARAGLAALRRGRRDRARAHRRRGALCRHGPLRPPARSARPGSASCCPRSRSTTWARARC